MAIFSTAIFMFLALSLSMVLASDHSRLQDFCVADLTSQVHVNGIACKDPKTVVQSLCSNCKDLTLLEFHSFVLIMLHGELTTTPHTHVNGIACKDPKTVGANDFAFSGLHKAGNTSNPIGSVVTPVTVFQLQGLNTLGISLVRIDYAPRSWLFLCFMAAKQGIKYRNGYGYCKKKQCIKRYVGSGNAVAIAALSSQNPGAITVANAVFGSVPDISGNIISRAFQLNKSVVNYLQSQF
ncbi:hypothetical protein FNV43_RR06333 [Rhamnella rubrinervis]|uniref:Cupin type-1 domain-containing protein n=1 Tax=Rhamnella rubrinervis TaxID=2594499 RepID=A0A8K0HEE2_9ROSA|nr:hypothetical protein FNV43_RR06333 [Rhamnella rubrinervis]